MDNSQVKSWRFFCRVRDGVQRRWRRFEVEIASRMGRYDRWKQVDWKKVNRLVFICSGNICRSPFAEAIARASGVEAVSCGTNASGVANADPVAVTIADRFNICLRAHISTRLADVPICRSDLMVVMDTTQLFYANTVARSMGAQVTLLGLWDGHHPVVIWDPYGQSDLEFEKCFRRTNSCMQAMLKAWKSGVGRD